MLEVRRIANRLDDCADNAYIYSIESRKDCIDIVAQQMAEAVEDNISLRAKLKPAAKSMLSAMEDYDLLNNPDEYGSYVEDIKERMYDLTRKRPDLWEMELMMSAFVLGSSSILMLGFLAYALDNYDYIR